MSKDRRKLYWLVGSAAGAWFLSGQLLHAIAGPGYHPPATESWLAYLTILGPPLIFALWAALLIGTDWRSVLPVSAGLATASQLGSVASDLLTHLGGEPVNHDTWFGDSYYWTGRLHSWLLSFLVFSALVSVCVLSVRVARRRNSAV